MSYTPRISLSVNHVQKRPLPSNWYPSIERQSHFFQQGHIVLLNEPLALTHEIWAESQKKSKLWRYHLHYFECFLSQNIEDIRLGKQLLEQWLHCCPPYSPDAWEPYPISLRIVHLIKFQLNGGEFNSEVLASLYLQARYLYKIPEYHLLGNHLFENAKALIFAGLFFDGKEAGQWFALGHSILEREIPEQILEDGGHFELSPMYHAIILEGLLDLYNLYQSMGRTFSECWSKKLSQMRFWLQVMSHPDGDISFFNDSALSAAPKPAELEAYALRLKLGKTAKVTQAITVLPNSGYIRLQNKDAVILLDCARVGPDYLPGHAHADTLSFELSLLGRRMIVNSGISSYQDLALRFWQRSTAAHSTVEVDHHNSSEVFACFRVGRRAYPLDIQYQEHEGRLEVTASHTGYQHSLSCTHQRSWCLTEHGLEIKDELIALGSEKHSLDAIARFFIHPQMKASLSEKGHIILPEATLSSEQLPQLRPAHYYPQFGLSQDNQVVEYHFDQNCSVYISWGT